MKPGGHWIERKAAASLYPSQVESALEQLNKNWAGSGDGLLELIEQFPLGDTAVLQLLAMSSICAARLAGTPELLRWLSRPEISQNTRSYAEMSNDLYQASEGAIAANNFRALRKWKSWEMTRIALRELAGVAALEETTAELSQLAEICIRSVFEHWDSQLRESFGSPAAEFTILGLGKLGGRELNHSSDVDLIFMYSDEGSVSPRMSNHEWFNRLGENIVTTFSTTDPFGSLFRVDLRLRPEGSAGSIARSLVSMENYYSGFGETWERIALIKARRVSGNRELAYEFLQRHQSFIYPRSPTPDLLDEIAGIKQRIEREIAEAGHLDRNVKLGKGGIREIEFVVQTLQLIHGARLTFLQETSTLKALAALGRLELIPGKQVLELDRAYRFLRTVEHRLQIEAEQQVHTIPIQAEAVGRLALSLQYPSAEALMSAVKETMREVRAVFEKVILTRRTESTGIDLSIFRDEKSATKALDDLAKGAPKFHVASRTRQGLRKLKPLLVQQLAKATDPDTTLNQFVRFIEAYGLRSLLFELLAANPKLLELLVKTFDSSRFAGDLLIRRPQLLEEITRDPTFYEPRSVQENLKRLHSLGDSADKLQVARAYRQRQLLRIILRDVVDLAEPKATFAELSDLAEACLLFAHETLDPNDLSIIGLGKFGGREISYGADLDIVFVGTDIRAAQNLVVSTGQPTADGNIAVLDARLRPDGEKGPLTASLEAYEAYYRERAQLWEIQALTRARPILGPGRADYIEMAKKVWQETAHKPDLFQQIDKMLERIREQRGSGNDFLEFKTGTGGMVEAEFMVQALQMQHGIWSPSWHGALTLLREGAIISKKDAAKAEGAYEFLRNCEMSLRRSDNKSVTALPTDVHEGQKLVKRLGYKTKDLFVDEYNEARRTIHGLYQQYVSSAR